MNRRRWARMAVISLICGGLISAGYNPSDDAAIAQEAPTDLSGVPQAWDKNLPTEKRFTVLASFANAAVLDKNTGLVWEQTPDDTIREWDKAGYYCVNKKVGGTAGWRLPSVVELMSVLDPTLGAPFVSPKIFTGIRSPSGYWSATTIADEPTFAWVVDFGRGLAVFSIKNRPSLAWCVRGPMQESVLGGMPR